MKSVEILFILSLTFSIIKANDENICLTSNCGNLFITYPFKLQNSRTQDNCSYIDLTCNNTTDRATINLPNAGNFYVIDIDYEYPFIQLHNTRHCLMMRRLMSNNFSLSSSPLEAIVGLNYTFYSCPSYPNTTLQLYPIDCLSTPTNVTVAKYSDQSSENMTDVCHEIGSKVLPISLSGEDHDLYLKWDPTTTSCPACEKTSPFHPDPIYRGGNKSWEAPRKQDEPSDYSPYLSPAYITPAFVLIAVVIVGCLTVVRGIMAEKNEAEGLELSAVATAARPPGRVEESRISPYTELLVLSETDSRTCPICLESFELLHLSRSIAKCGHCFHDECLVPWLIQTGTCPVCRVIVSDS